MEKIMHQTNSRAIILTYSHSFVVTIRKNSHYENSSSTT